MCIRREVQDGPGDVPLLRLQQSGGGAVACTGLRHLGWMCSTSARTQIFEIAFSGVRVLQNMLQIMFGCASAQDVRDHLNELAELATRASGFMGTGFAAEVASWQWKAAPCFRPFLAGRRKSRTWTSMCFGYALLSVRWQELGILLSRRGPLYQEERESHVKRSWQSVQLTRH